MKTGAMGIILSLGILLALIMVISQIQIPVVETESVVLDNPFVTSTNYTVGMTGSAPTPDPTEEPTREPNPTEEPEPTTTPEPDPAEEPAPEPECHPSYEGACLDPNAEDYDCEGGSGDGPLYTGEVTVVGEDVFRLDHDGDGVGCEDVTPLNADAGSDQTFPGPSPVEVQFDGSGSEGDIVTYKWFNQFAELRAEGVSPTLEVNFGHKDTQPGTTRTFTLEVADSGGNTSKDTVVITLGETPPSGSGSCVCSAEAGPDQTVPGPSPVEVQFDGSGSTGDIVSYKWINQFGEVRAEEVSPTFEVNFGRNPRPGVTRTFTLENADAEGNTDTDTIKITLGETAKDNEGQGDPAQEQGLTGAEHVYEAWGTGGNVQSIIVGILEDGRWYLASLGGGEEYMWGNHARVTCHQGTHWEVKEGNTIDREGCVGDAAGLGELAVLIGNDGWVISGTSTLGRLATLTPNDPDDLWLFEGTHQINR
jgi:hypothetical protein